MSTGGVGDHRRAALVGHQRQVQARILLHQQHRQAMRGAHPGQADAQPGAEFAGLGHELVERAHTELGTHGQHEDHVGHRHHGHQIRTGSTFLEASWAPRDSS
jgi:hypothetical protein